MITSKLYFSLYRLFSFSIILIFSLILSIQDIKKMYVSIYVQLLSILCALLCHLFFAREGMWIYVISSLIMGTFYFIVRKITKCKLGPADVLFGFFQGLFIIPKLIPFCLIIEDCIAMIFINKKFIKEPFAFIPSMSFGLITCYIIQIFL